MGLFRCLTRIEEFVIYTSLTVNQRLKTGHNKKTGASKRPTPTPWDNSLAVRSRKRATLGIFGDEVQVIVLDHEDDNLSCDGVELQDPAPSTSASNGVDIDRASVIH